MNKEKEEHCHYSGLPSPKAYAKDEVDYDGMGNQGRIPKHSKDEQDWFLMFLVCSIGFLFIMLISFILYEHILST